MKTAVIITSLLLLSAFYSGVSHAQTDDEEQKSFELEEDNVQIRDTEAERIAAEKEAKHQQQIEAQREAELKKILTEKDRVSKKAKIDIANAEVKRIKAEKEIKMENTEIAKLKSQIEVLRNKVATAEGNAKTAQQTVETGRQEIQKIKLEQSDLTVRKRKADMANVMLGARIARLKSEYQRLVQERNRSLTLTKKAEQDSYKNQGTQNNLSRDISNIKGADTSN